MCGKSNPANLDVCQYCQARLKPLHVSPSDAGSSTSSPSISSDIPGSDESAPEWLRSLRLEEDLSELEEPQAGDDMPDWLDDSDEGSSPDLADAETGQLPDWLTNLRHEDSETIEPADNKEAEPEDAESSWGELDAEMPDWLANIRNEEEPGTSAKESEDIPLEQVEEEPDWLQRIRSRTQEETGSSLVKEPGKADQSADWPTASFQEEEADAAGQGEQPAETVEPGEIPDWLSELSEEQEMEPLESDQEWPAEEQPPAADVPPEAKSPVQPPSAAPFDTGTLRALYSEEGEAEVPSWMARFSGETEAKAAESEGQEKAEEAPPPTDEAGTEEAAVGDVERESPELDWLTDIQQAALREQPEEEKPLLFTSSGAISPFMLEEAGDEGEEAQAAAEGAEIAGESVAGISPAVPAEIPDWLAEVAPRESGVGEPDEIDEEVSPGHPSGQAEIAPGELPSWLEAMRPVEFAASKPPPVEEGADRIESVGPLAGLRGVLPAEPDVSRIGKPSGYSIKLQVSDAQQTHASLLEALVKEEGQARPLPQRSVISSQHILRLVITLVLIVAVLFPMLMDWPQESPPAFPPAAGAVNFYINNLQTGAPVLIAVDYEPGWSGEMDATAVGVIRHLELEGAYPAFISTIPTGPAQAEHLLALTTGQGSSSGWQAGQNYANLGFVPGGAAGLLSFAQSPQTISPAYTETGRRAWDEGSLVNVHAVSDFALAIVITQNPDTARTWIEQVGPYLGEHTPLLMLLSAQAEPLVRPYYQEFQQQVKGMVIGLVGGASYENLNGQPILALTYWNAFNLAIIAAVVIIFLGALINASLAAAGKSKNETRREGAQ